MCYVSQLLFISFCCVQADTSYFQFSSSDCHNVSVADFKQILIQNHVIYYSTFKKKTFKNLYNKSLCPEDFFKGFLHYTHSEDAIELTSSIVILAEYLLCTKFYAY